MGVEIETITPGDGGNNPLFVTLCYCFSITEVIVCYDGRFLPHFQDEHFRRRASASLFTMSVSEELKEG